MNTSHKKSWGALILMSILYCSLLVSCSKRTSTKEPTIDTNTQEITIPNTHAISSLMTYEFNTTNENISTESEETTTALSIIDENDMIQSVSGDSYSILSIDPISSGWIIRFNDKVSVNNEASSSVYYVPKSIQNTAPIPLDFGYDYYFLKEQ